VYQDRPSDDGIDLGENDKRGFNWRLLVLLLLLTGFWYFFIVFLVRIFGHPA